MGEPAQVADAAPANDLVLEAFEENLWLPFAHAAGQAWMSLGDEPDHRWAVSGIGMGAYNAVSRARLADQEADARIDAVLERFDRAGVPMSWWVLPTSRPADLAARLEARGLALSGPLPVMGLALAHWHAPAWPAGVDVSLVRTPEDYVEACRVVADGYPVPWEAFQAVAQRYGELMAAAAALRCYVARAEGRVISSAVAMRDGSAVGLWNVATLPDARRRGAATAVTISALDDARSDGYGLAVLSSTAAALSLYRRLGFREAGELWIAGKGFLG